MEEETTTPLAARPEDLHAEVAAEASHLEEVRQRGGGDQQGQGIVHIEAPHLRQRMAVGWQRGWGRKLGVGVEFVLFLFIFFCFGQFLCKIITHEPSLFVFWISL